MSYWFITLYRKKNACILQLRRDLQQLFCLQDCYSRIAQVEYQGQTQNTRILECKPLIYTFYCIQHRLELKYFTCCPGTHRCRWQCASVEPAGSGRWRWRCYGCGLSCHDVYKAVPTVAAAAAGTDWNTAAPEACHSNSRRGRQGAVPNPLQEAAGGGGGQGHSYAASAAASTTQ